MIDVQPFFYWMNERYQIWYNRQSGQPWPWTKDAILQEYSFCNVFRELDKVTIWIRENIREPYADHPNLWFLLAMARQINWPDTLSDILEYTGLPDVWNPDEVREIMELRQQKKYKVYTGAYMLTGAGAAGRTKPWFTCHHILDTVWKAVREGDMPACLTSNPHDAATIEECVRWFSQFNGWKGFLSYEVATDMRWTRYLNHAPDIYTWANPGPGARRGLNRLFGRELEQPIKERQLVDEMFYLLHLANGEEISPYLLDKYPHLKDWNWFVDQREAMVSEAIQNSGFFPLEMRDIEHSLCETDKYLRVKLGEGKPRAKYQRTKE